MKIDSEMEAILSMSIFEKCRNVWTAWRETREEIIEMAEKGDFSASIDVGDTATLEPGEPATVKNVGTIRDAIFNFGIPKGKTGATGPRGPQGVQGIQGPPGEDGEDGGNGIVTELGPGLFGMYVNEDGHLIMVVTQGEEVPTLKIVDGRLKIYPWGGRNMIRATFNDNEEYIRVNGLTQWDYGQELQIIGLGLVQNAEVHFALEGCREARIQTVKIENEILYARIPDKLLEKGENIKAYVYLATPDHGETIKTIAMPVVRRPRPDDYSSTGEKNLLRELMEKVELKADNIHQ